MAQEERRNRQTSSDLRSLGFKRDDVRAVAELYGVRKDKAAQMLIGSGLRGEAIGRQRTLRGISRTDAAQVTLALNDKKILEEIV